MLKFIHYGAFALATLSAIIGLVLVLVACTTPAGPWAVYVLTNELPRADGQPWPAPAWSNAPDVHVEVQP